MKIEEALKHFAEDNEKCYIHFANGEIIYVTILEIGDGFVRIDDGASESIVNVNYIMRVRAVPKKNVNKKKEVTKNKSVLKEFFGVED